MSVYKNIDGTSKKSFRIGTKGVTLSTETILVDEANGEKIKRLLVEDKAVYTEENKQDIFIERRYVSKWIPSEDGKQCTFEMKIYSEETREWRTESITIKSSEEQKGGVQSTGSSTAGNIAVWGDEEGQLLRDDGFKILNSFLNENGEAMKDPKAIPTVAAVVEYVEGKEKPLDDRTTGLNAQILY